MIAAIDKGKRLAACTLLSLIVSLTAGLSTEFRCAWAQADVSSSEGMLGIGIQGFPDNTLRVISVAPGSQAIKSGIAIGDALLSIDGKRIQDIGLNNIAGTLRGDVGTTVSITLLSSTKGQYTAAITRVPKSEFSQQKSKAIHTATEEIVDANWQTYSNPAAGYSIKYPPTWQISTNLKTGELNVTASSGAKLSVLPIFIAGKSIAEAPHLFNAILKNMAPNASWSQPVSTTSNAFKSTSVSASGILTGAGVFRTSATGLIGQICIAADSTNDSTTLAQFAEMMNTMRFTPRAGGSAPGLLPNVPPSVSYHRFVDPNENAFWCDVPDGWEIQGGMKRVTAVDTRPWVTASSPDGKTVVFLGDPDLCPGTIPTPLLTSTGYYPGRMYGDSLVLPYHSALKFIERYNKVKTSKVFSSMQMVQSQEHPDVDRMYNLNSSMHSAASAKFTGIYRGVPGIAFFLAATRGQWQANSGMWWVTLFGGFLTTADQEQLAFTIYSHMLSTVEYNPEWSRAATANAGAVSRAWTASSNALSQSITDGYWSRQATNEQAAHNFSNYIRGTADVKDPQTGTTYQVQYGPQQHWIDQGGTIIGTDNTISPGYDWRALIKIGQ